MDRSTRNPSVQPTDLPAPVPRRTPSPHLRPPRRSTGHAENEHIPVDIPPPPASPGKRSKYPTLRVALICVTLAACAAAVLVPTVRSAVSESGGSGGSAGQVLGGILLEGGLPPTDRPFLGGAAETDSTLAESEIPGPEDNGAESHPGGHEPPVTGETASDPADGTGSDPATEESTTASETSAVSESVGESASESDSVPVSDTEPSEPPFTDTEPPATDTDPSETDTDPDESASGPTEPPDTEPTDPKPSESEPADTEPSEPMPEGAFPIVRQDLSEPDRSVGYIHGTADRLPPAIPGEGTRLWSTTGAPTVLIVHTHPFEGYHDGSPWYDPATGPLSRTESQNDPDGVVALGARLTRALRESGVTVIHLRVPVGDGESASSTYSRTEEMVRYYCDLYPDIGLILDLRRSAELTDAGEILQTAGTYNGESCAQLRFSVSGDRATPSVARDIALAVSLRRALWAEEPTLSRPVWVKSGEGLAADLGDVAVLTVEVGSAGNTFEEAVRVMDVLAQVLGREVLR